MFYFSQAFPPETASPKKVVINSDKMKNVPLPKNDHAVEEDSSNSGGATTTCSAVIGDTESKNNEVAPTVTDIIEGKKSVQAMKVDHIDYATDYDTDYETDGEDDDKCVVM